MKRKILLTFLCLFFVGCASMMSNQRFLDAMNGGRIYVGMTKQDLINTVGYPPEGTGAPNMFYDGAVQTKVTSEGTEELWKYEYGVAGMGAGVKCVTFKIVNNQVKEWYDWVDTR